MDRPATDTFGHQPSPNSPPHESRPSNISTATLVELNAESLPQDLQNRSDAEAERETLLKCAEVARTRIISLTSQESLRPRKYVKWGVQWHRQPLLMVSFALVGIILAVGHHFYYSRLSGTRVGSERRQQWEHALGNVFAILVVSGLAAANRAAYKQYMWTLLRRKSFSLRSIDGLFSLTSDPMSLLNLEILRHAPLAMLLAVLCWIILLTGLLPPGTLVVVQGTIPYSEIILMPSLNWTVGDPQFPGSPWTDTASLGLSPSNEVVSVASRVAEGMSMLDISPPDLNPSFELTIRGPYMQCEEANATQIPIFEFYKNVTAIDHMITSYTEAQLPQNLSSSPIVWQGVVLSIFDPFLGTDGWGRGINTGVMYSWHVDLPLNFSSSVGYVPEYLSNISYCNATATRPHCQMFPRQLWVNTANDSIVCTLGNATQTAHFDFVDGQQTVTYEDLQDFEPLFVPRTGYLQNSSDSSHLLVNFQLYPYMAVYQSLANMLVGNVTIVLGNGKDQIYQRSNNILLTGLQACREIADNYWVQKYPSNLSVFEAPLYMCRNKTLAKGIEDLSTNITMSMLSLSDFVTPDSVDTEVTMTPSYNIYHYNLFPLLLSYGIAIVFTIFTVLLGLQAFKMNGVAHSTAFSAIVATTRNPALDSLSEGHSLGSYPLDKQMAGLKLKFGGIEVGQKGIRAGFGFAGEVSELRRRALYI